MSEYIVTVGEGKNDINLSKNSSLSLNGKDYHYELSLLSCNTYLLKIENKLYKVSAKRINTEKYIISLDGKQFETIIRTALQEKASSLIEKSSASKHKLDVKAPMPGMILKIKKGKGEQISRGDSIIILEAMKMENDLRAPVSGTITNLNVKEGTAVEKGVVLFTIE